MIFLCGEEPDLQRIPAHSWVLVEKSPVFRAMFRGPLTLYSSLPFQPLPPSQCTSGAGGSSRAIAESRQLQQQQQCSKASQPQISSQRHRSSSGTSFDKYVASSLSTIQDNEDDEEALAAAELEAEAAMASVNGLNQTADLASQDNVYKPIEFEVKTATAAASGTFNSLETHSKPETSTAAADHDEDLGNPADDPRFISKKLIPAIGGYIFTICRIFLIFGIATILVTDDSYCCFNCLGKISKIFSKV